MTFANKYVLQYLEIALQKDQNTKYVNFPKPSYSTETLRIPLLWPLFGFSLDLVIASLPILKSEKAHKRDLSDTLDSNFI